MRHLDSNRFYQFGNTEAKYPKGEIEMSNNRISARFSQADRDAVMKAKTATQFLGHVLPLMLRV